LLAERAAAWIAREDDPQLRDCPFDGENFFGIFEMRVILPPVDISGLEP
jgi:hypothetical protein